MRCVHRLKVRETATALGYRSMLSEHHFDSLDWLPVLSEQAQVTGDIVVLTLIPVETE